MSKQNNISRKLNLDSPERKPSVFERLGTKSSSSSSSSAKNVCQSWAQNGTCSLNKTCKYAHTHVLISPSKRLKAEAMKKQSLVVQKRTGKEEHKKSSRSHQCPEAEWEGWELGDLEDADEKVLERRKQELQRELQLQLKKEELTRKKVKRSDKKRASSTSSSSSSTTESSSSTTSSSSSSSEPRKRQSRKRKHGSTSSDSDVSSSHRPRKSPKTVKVKVSNSKKTIDKKESKNSSEARSKSVVVAKKSGTQKKSASPSWEKSRARTPHSKQQQAPLSKKSSPHQSPVDSKNRSPSPRYDRSIAKSKTRTSPKLKVKESSPKRTAKKVKESNSHSKDKMKQSPVKSRSSPGRTHKVSPSRSRRHDENSEKRRGHYDDRKHSPRRERSREKERKRDVRRGHSNENDNGGLKKGGKILPLKPSSYTKDNTIKSKESSRRKSAEKTGEGKTKEVDSEKDKMRTDRDKDRNEKDKSKSDRDKLKHKKSETHDRHSARDRDSDRGSLRGRDDRGRDREAERLRIAKEREAERQKERDEALERCRERQRERERLEKERKEKEEKKHQRDGDGKQKDGDRELPSLLDLKTENPRGHSDSGNNSKSSDKHMQRDGRRNADKGSEKAVNPDRDGRDRDRLSQRPQGSPSDKEHDRRRGVDDNDRRQTDKEYDSRRNRDGDPRHVPDLRRTGPMGRRIDDPECRRPWDDLRRVMDGPHDRRRLLEAGLDDRRGHPMLRRGVDDQYDYRRGRDDPDLDVRDFPPDDRRARKLLHGFHHDGPDWDPKGAELDYRDAELRDEWNHPDRHHDWALRYDHKWLDREEPRDSVWNHYARRPPHDDWNNDWVPDDQPRSLYREPNEDQLDMMNDGFTDHNGRRHSEIEPPPHIETCKDQPQTAASDALPRWEKKTEGDALSDISDDPDDILNQDDEGHDNAGSATSSAPPATAAAATPAPSIVPPAADIGANQNGALVNNDTNNNQNASSATNNVSSTVQTSDHQVYVKNSDFFFDQRRPLLECFGERALDFEEISDEELEEEARASKGKGIMDVLGADWAGLIKDVRPRPKRQEGPVLAHQRWMLERLVTRIGISVKYAGRDFSDALINKYKEIKQEVKQEVQDDEEMPKVEDIKQEDDKDSCPEDVKAQNISVNVTVKLEPEEAEQSLQEKPEIGIHLYHDVPALHNSIRECRSFRSSLFSAHNRFKRALSARTDLSLRRELCNIPSKEPLHFTSPLDNKMYENSIKLFQRTS